MRELYLPYVSHRKEVFEDRIKCNYHQLYLTGMMGPHHVHAETPLR